MDTESVRGARPSPARVRRLACIVAVAAFVIAGLAGSSIFGLRAAYSFGRQSFEPQSAAEERCSGLLRPPTYSDTPAWARCVGREARTSPLDAAGPDAMAGAACLGAGLGGAIVTIFVALWRKNGLAAGIR